MIPLSIIIINYRSPDILHCLQSIYSSLTLPFEIIVVDNHSRDGAVAKIKETFPRTTIIENTINKGYGAACNQAIKIANGKHVLILNPDIILEQNTIQELLHY